MTYQIAKKIIWHFQSYPEVGDVANKLELPAGINIHVGFHLSHLKKYVGPKVVLCLYLPFVIPDEKANLQLVRVTVLSHTLHSVLASRLVLALYNEVQNLNPFGILNAPTHSLYLVFHLSNDPLHERVKGYQVYKRRVQERQRLANINATAEAISIHKLVFQEDKKFM